ncbi:ABC transporter substrate-binding protein [Paenibacillus gorillae]|uniref:ABC transporter substrate-binding protein n=1 Tax=Paenibacillus gorillae TaxID=1243662 RepID=UPI0005AB6C1C|nr:extracellular solute-binding protein [Paenibacillus gorillae]
MSTRKYLLVIAGAALLSVFLFVPDVNRGVPSAVTDPKGESDMTPEVREYAEEDPESIVVTVSMNPEEYERLRVENNRFMMKYPNINVELNNIEQDAVAHDVWVEQLQLGEAPDVMLMNSGWVQELAVKGYLLPTDSLGTGTGDPAPDQPVRLRAPLLWNSYLWGVPLDANPSIIVWNKSMLAEASLKDPPKDWDSFKELAMQVRAADPEAGTVALYPGGLNQLLYWLDAWVPNNLADAAYLRGGNETRNDRLRWLGTTENPGGLFRLSNKLTLGSELESLHLLSAVVSWSEYRALPQVQQNKLVIDHNEPKHVWMDSRSYVVSSGSRAAESAFAWVAEMTSANVQQQNYKRFGRLPAINSLYQSNSFTSSVSETPPYWWMPLLNEDPIGKPPDPEWQERKAGWEALWRQYAIGAIDIEAFIGAVQQVHNSSVNGL